MAGNPSRCSHGAGGGSSYQGSRRRIASFEVPICVGDPIWDAAARKLHYQVPPVPGSWHDYMMYCGGSDLAVVSSNQLVPASAQVPVVVGDPIWDAAASALNFVVPPVSGPFNDLMISDGGNVSWMNLVPVNAQDVTEEVHEALIEREKKKTLARLFYEDAGLRHELDVGFYRCPFCPELPCRRWTSYDLLEHARAFGNPRRFYYKSVGKHQALEQYILTA